MKKYFKVFIVFTILSIQVFSQCDSVRVKMSTYSGDTDKNLSKTVSQYDNDEQYAFVFCDYYGSVRVEIRDLKVDVPFNGSLVCLFLFVFPL